MSTTLPILFDISSPDADLQAQVYRGLLDIPELALTPVGVVQPPPSGSKFRDYALYESRVLKVVRDMRVQRGTSALGNCLGNGILSEFFILMDSWDEQYENSQATMAYSFLKKELLQTIRVVHLHVKSPPSENQARRMALSRLSVRKADGEEWFTFDKPDIQAIAAKIRECASKP